jgi:general secretion pathway protein G
MRIVFKNEIRMAGELGFTLIESVCVLILLIILVILVTPKIEGRGDGKLVATMKDIGRISTALKYYKEDTGTYPFGTNAWQNLLQQRAGVTNWHGPYLEGVPMDPWHHPFVYEYPGKHISEGYPYDVYSLGPQPNGRVLGNWGISKP